jgi:hypothetical protein
MKIEYAQDVYVILKGEKNILKYDFLDFIESLDNGKINLNQIEFLTQEGQVALRELKSCNGVFVRE